MRRTLSSAKDGPRFTEPKTEKSRRSVMLSGPAVEALVHHRKAQDAQRTEMANLWEDDNDLVFRSTTGSPLQRHNLVTRSFKPLLKRAGLPDMTFHGLRHTAASLLFSQNVHPKVVQEMLGHSDISMTLNIYSHMIPGMQAGAARAMESALS